MTIHSERKDAMKREKMQRRFWDEVGSAEHISMPELENAVKREFKCTDNRSVKTQIELMQTEARIRIESRVKVWIKTPH